LTGSKLKIDIRRNKILEQLRLEGKVSVAELSASLDVTPVTIRSDLTILEQEGHLVRVQGGAVQLPGAEYLPIPEEADAHAEQKKAIGTAVARLIQDGDTLFINSGTTCEHIALALNARRNLNIVTNAVHVAEKLGTIPTFRVLLVGGELNALYGFTHGGDAQEQLSRYQADWAILSVDGISARGGVTTHHAEEVVIDRMMIAGAKNKLIAADGSKIGRAGFSRVCECSGELILVTDGSGDEEALSQLVECGVRVTCA